MRAEQHPCVACQRLVREVLDSRVGRHPPASPPNPSRFHLWKQTNLERLAPLRSHLPLEEAFDTPEHRFGKMRTAGLKPYTLGAHRVKDRRRKEPACWDHSHTRQTPWLPWGDRRKVSHSLGNTASSILHSSEATRSIAATHSFRSRKHKLPAVSHPLRL